MINGSRNGGRFIVAVRMFAPLLHKLIKNI